MDDHRVHVGAESAGRPLIQIPGVFLAQMQKRAKDAKLLVIEQSQTDGYTWIMFKIQAPFPAFLDTAGIQHAGNHTGKVLKLALPVYDPRWVTQAMVERAQKP